MSSHHIIASRIRQGKSAQPADLVLKGGRVLDVVTGELIDGDVAICADTIVGIGASYDGLQVQDVSGLTLVPGFIDTHLHVESSLVTPFEFERCVAPRGITTAICDPHEIANVLGVPGIQYFLDASERMVIDLRVNLSSCVPSTHMETSGAHISADDLVPLMAHPAVIGLAEMMNYPGVIHEDPEVMAKLALFFGHHIDGHAPLLRGKDLNAYISAGIRTEHEATTADEAREKLQKGLRVLIREGSVSKDLDALLPLLTERTSAYMCLCTDDRNPLDIGEEGHLDYMIRHAIAQGVSPLAVYRAASLSAAEAFGLKDRGQIAPGKRADIVGVADLSKCDAQMVYAGGRLVNDEAFSRREIIDAPGRGSVLANPVDVLSLQVQDTKSLTHVIGVIEGKIITEHLHIDIPPENGVKSANPSQDLAKITIIERHGQNGNIASGFLRGFGLKQGAVGSTVCHDHHNIAVVGVDDHDMAIAANRLREIDGGFVVVDAGRVIAELPLPIAGLMSDASYETVLERLIVLRSAAASLGITLAEPFLQLAFVALPVIPTLKITDHGLVDVNAFKIID